MHQVKKYTDPQTAIADCRSWLSPTQIGALETIARTSPLESFTCAMDFVGITGYPVQPFYHHLRGEPTLPPALAEKLHSGARVDGWRYTTSSGELRADGPTGTYIESSNNVWEHL